MRLFPSLQFNPGVFLNSTLPPVREISNVVMDQPYQIVSAEKITDMGNMWGQFLIHNMAFSKPDPNYPMPIPVPKCDAYFDPRCTGNMTMPYFRTGFTKVSCTKTTSTRQSDGFCYEQINTMSSYIDANPVYGTTKDTADLLRSFDKGKMIVDHGPNGDMPPRGISGVTIDNDARRYPTDQLFSVGERRGNENPGLTSIHVVLLREHNRLADKFGRLNPQWDDEAIFQQTRSCIIEQVQKISYEEYLTTILGEFPQYTGYDENTDVSVSTEFTTAAFRFGHSEVGPNIEMVNRDGSFGKPLSIRDAYFNPTALDNGIENVVRGLIYKQEANVDIYIISELRNFLFGKPGQGGMDLGSRNLMRNRDHGMPSYNQMRRYMGLPAVNTWADISSDIEVQERLRFAYHGDIELVDAYVGGLAEDHMYKAAVGQTFYHLILDQFVRTRKGDRFWYELPEIRKVNEQCESTSFSKLIRRNTNDIGPLPKNVFLLASDSNPLEN
ncbi:hypothetical protein SAMD00019534_044130 [Acytostelium subglobosum LB1]|uniref:hypothetical protein n=1 Tax=Acytostelium subglobosum LB1 TaxID=1410327 RepID=UPI000644865B|nr:hypothetical protein SAMD00019534_044130 [Acytostelium subglobosum LB1]GAM21238.1 hypothetical protein SAMD00019534_044130 [Acytostelium subglobosum LB1]|eukprot:XP_012755357.1 hypothetical protein SAMD00019534_044130 [Acytostelium subglobosum LB1]